MSLTNVGKISEPFLAPEKGIGDALVNKGAETPNPHLPPVEVRILSFAAGGLLPSGTASTTLRTIPTVSLEFLPDRRDLF